MPCPHDVSLLSAYLSAQNVIHSSFTLTMTLAQGEEHKVAVGQQDTRRLRHLRIFTINAAWSGSCFTHYDTKASLKLMI